VESSPYSIDLISDTGQTERLLDAGDEIGDPLEFSIRQTVAEHGGNDGEWGGANAHGGCRRMVVLDRVSRHASSAAADTFCQAYPGRFPHGTSGKIRISIPNGQTWEMCDVVVHAVKCRPLPEPTAVLTTYQIDAGKTVPVSGLDWYAGIPCYWDLSTHSGQSRTHDGTLIPPVMPEFPQLEIRMTHDATGYWCEVGFNVFEELSGSPSAGWSPPSLPGLKMQLQRSTDLVAWYEGGFEDCAGSPTELEDGSWDYWTRCSAPSYWEQTMMDFVLTVDRYGKAITNITLLGSTISLPGYPYAMPAAAATLQADLRTAGYTGAIVTTSSAPLTAVVKNHVAGGTPILPVTMSGSNVTAVSWQGSTISLPGYPYAMPGSAATLQSNLRSAGFSAAVVTLYDDPWTITLPNRLVTGNSRPFAVTFTPGDPYATWDFFGNYLGEAAGNDTSGTFQNVRDPNGNPLAEADKQFFRMKIFVP
jgi:hypothetical protein